ncbi:Zn-ribbon domain-containing OB-fold protein [Candidatus Micrarchaeota archaeon]|nr:Zn-ribbon domain-containing OB-fold protein [Candidatus Micrarchaeota archaeon]MBI5228519.1 Zn-ribbon domain-containing OB-fold protein [Candidatus Micrarchaeota archaeon]
MVSPSSSLIWREIPERYGMVGSVCQTCGASYFPQRKVCPKCRRKGKLALQKMPENGRIYAFTEVHSAPRGFENESPYFLAIIELSNGVRVLAQIVDSEKEKVKAGATVEMRFRKIFEAGKEGILAYGYKFKVV